MNTELEKLEAEVKSAKASYDDAHYNAYTAMHIANTYYAALEDARSKLRTFHRGTKQVDKIARLEETLK